MNEAPWIGGNELTWTRHSTEGVSKNDIAMGGSVFYIALANHVEDTFVTASISDCKHLVGHRWRDVSGHVYTTIMSGTMEYKWPIENVLLGVDRKAIIEHRNGNQYDVRRENLKKPRLASPPNKISFDKHDATVAYIHIRRTKVVIDADAVDEVKTYCWWILREKRRSGQRVSVRARFWDKTQQMRYVLLPRLLLGCSEFDVPVIHKNGNRLDCRRENLTLFEE